MVWLVQLNTGTMIGLQCPRIEVIESGLAGPPLGGFPVGSPLAHNKFGMIKSAKKGSNRKKVQGFIINLNVE